MSKVLDAESYLKSGSNELRILEYRAAGRSFGINILKVNKIVSELDSFTKVPESHPAVSGIFRDRGRLIPIVDLAAFLGITDEKSSRKKVIVTEFFGTLTGFWVDAIDWIHHFRWADVIDAQKVFANVGHQYVIGIVKPTEDRMVQLLDYETILIDVCPKFAEKNTVTYEGSTAIAGKRVLIAEDSPAVRLMLVDSLTQFGYDVTEAGDGAVAWDQFRQNPFDLVICDVEMPQMDGLALTLQIRQSERGETPVIVYSSIGDMGMKARAAFLKADAHITKLNLDKLLDTAEALITGRKVDSSVALRSAEVEAEREMEVVPLD